MITDIVYDYLYLVEDFLLEIERRVRALPNWVLVLYLHVMRWSLDRDLAHADLEPFAEMLQIKTQGDRLVQNFDSTQLTGTRAVIEDQLTRWLEQDLNEAVLSQLFPESESEFKGRTEHFKVDQLKKTTYEDDRKLNINRYRLYLRKSNFKSKNFHLIEDEFNLVEETEEINFDLYAANAKIGSAGGPSNRRHGEGEDPLIARQAPAQSGKCAGRAARVLRESVSHHRE